MRLSIVPTVVPRLVGGERGAHALEKHSVVRRRARRSAKWSDALHHLGMAHRPLKSLLRTHRPSDHQRDALRAELLRDQTMLRHHVVMDGDLREACAIERWG